MGTKVALLQPVCHNCLRPPGGSCLPKTGKAILWGHGDCRWESTGDNAGRPASCWQPGPSCSTWGRRVFRRGLALGESGESRGPCLASRASREGAAQAPVQTSSLSDLTCCPAAPHWAPAIPLAWAQDHLQTQDF